MAIEIMPPELRIKTVTQCVGDDIGWLLTLDCGHTVWAAIQLNPGQKTHCGRCVDLYHQKVLAK